MSDQERRRVAGVRPSRRVRQGGGPPQAALPRLAEAVGNREMLARLEDASARRDTLMTFAVERLRAVHQAQQEELAAVRDRKEWFRHVALGHPGWALPEPTRWHRSARAYRDAARALARGHLGRAVQLLERALQAEQAARAEQPAFLDPQRGAEAGVEPSPGMEGVDPGAGCPVVPLPPELVLADRILAVQEDAEPVRHLRPPRAPGWWEDEEEEEEEGEPGEQA